MPLFKHGGSQIAVATEIFLNHDRKIKSFGILPSQLGISFRSKLSISHRPLLHTTLRLVLPFGNL